MAKSRGVFEKTPKSDEWWIRYAGSDGKIHRERCTWDKIREAGIQVDAATRLERPGKALAQKLYRDRVAQRDRGAKLRAINAHRTVYFRELCADAVTHVRAHNRGAWIDELRIEKLRKKFGDYPAVAIPLQKLQAWFDAQKWSTSSYNRYRGTLSLIYRLAAKNHGLRENLSRLVERRKQEDNSRLRYLNQCSPLPTDDERLKFATTEEQRLRAVILRDYKWHYPEFQLALNCGIRPSEQFGLTWNQVSFERRQITIQLSKTGRARHVSLNSEAMTALRAVWERPVRKDRVFLGVDGQPLAGYRHWFEPAIKKAGLKGFTWYSLRHTFASRLAMAGVNIRTVADLMGHRTIQMTMRYAHLAPEHNLAAVEKLVDFSTDTKTDTDARMAIVRMQ